MCEQHVDLLQARRMRQMRGVLNEFEVLIMINFTFSKLICKACMTSAASVITTDNCEIPVVIRSLTAKLICKYKGSSEQGGNVCKI